MKFKDIIDKKINLENYDEFIEKGFKECSKCGWAYDPEFFEGHECPPKDKGKLPLPDKKYN